MALPSKLFLKRFAERVLWTAAEAGAAFGLSHVGLFPAEYVPVATVAFSIIKGLAARKIGDPNSPAIGA